MHPVLSQRCFEWRAVERIETTESAGVVDDYRDPQSLRAVGNQSVKILALLDILRSALSTVEILGNNDPAASEAIRSHFLLLLGDAVRLVFRRHSVIGADVHRV